MSDSIPTAAPLRVGPPPRHQLALMIWLSVFLAPDRSSPAARGASVRRPSRRFTLTELGAVVMAVSGGSPRSRSICQLLRSQS